MDDHDHHHGQVHGPGIRQDGTRRGVSAGPRPCSIAETLKVVGEKWSLLAIREVVYGVHRFADIQRNTGAPSDILTTRLRTLVAAGVLDRQPYQERPTRHEYLLTPAGHELGQVLLTLKEWGDRHLAPQIFGGPPVTLEHRCGATFSPRVVCAACREPLAHGTLTVGAAISDAAFAFPAP